MERSFIRSASTVLALLFLIHPTYGFARFGIKPEAIEADNHGEGEHIPFDELKDTLEEHKKIISEQVQILSTGIDSLFSQEDIKVQDDGSYVRVGQYSVFEEYKDPSYNFYVRARLEMPRAKEKLQLFLDSSEDERFGTTKSGQGGTNSTVQGSVRDQEYLLGVRGLVQKSARSAIAFDSGIKFRHGLDPFVRMTLRKNFAVDERKLNLLGRVYWFNSSKWGSSIAIDYDHRINENWLFRFANNGVVDHQSGLWEIDDYFALFQKITDRSSVAYRVGVLSTDEPTLAISEYYCFFDFRYVLIVPWLTFDVAPKLSWPKAEEGIDKWQRIAGIELKIEATY